MAGREGGVHLGPGGVGAGGGGGVTDAMGIKEHDQTVEYSSI